MKVRMSKTAKIISAGKRRIKTKRDLAIGMIIILILLLATLIYYYLIMTKPKISFVKPKLKDYEWVTGVYGISPNDRFDRPHDVTVDAQGYIYVADSGNSRVVKLSSNGNFIMKFGKKFTDKSKVTPTSSMGFLSNPLGVCVDPQNGDVYVTDRNLNKIAVFDRNGKYKRSWMVEMPVIPRVAGNKLYVTTYGPLYVFSKEGKVLAKWGTRGSKATDFDFPNGLAIDSSENLVVADTNNNQIKGLTPSGEIKWIEGARRKNFKDDTVKFQLLTGLTFDDSGLLYSADAFSFVIRAFAIQNGKPKFIQSFGRPGAADGELKYPGGIAYLGDRRFVVADEGNNRIQIIRIALSRKMAGAIPASQQKNTAKNPGKTTTPQPNPIDAILNYLGLN